MLDRRDAVTVAIRLISHARCSMARWPALSAGLSAMLAAVAGCGSAPPESAGSDFLYIWSGDADEADADFLAVFDVRPGSPRYGELITTVPVEGKGNWPHHTEYEATAHATLFANGWGTGRTFVFDVARPDAPRVATTFTAAGGYSYPHSFARLPNGNVLATFQSLDGEYAPAGGLVELDEGGNFVRGVSGAAPGVPLRETWPYSLLVLPELDRVVTTNTRMGMVAEWKAAMAGEHVHADADVESTHVLVWRLSDLQLLQVLQLPPQEGGHNVWPAEPRRLANGDVYVNTFSCGLYRIDGLATERAAVEAVLRSDFDGQHYCAVPAVLGNFWISPSATENAIVAYDLSQRARPREVSRLSLDGLFREPHWIAVDPHAPRLVVTADVENPWVMLVNVDPATGALSVDENFRDPGAARPGIGFNRAEWPHGRGGKAMPHGAVFRSVR
jgi:hypothetical protein